MAFVKVNNIENKLSAPVDTFWRINKTSLLESIELVCEWPFDRVILAHGSLLQQAARRQVREAYAYLEEEDSTT
jgi:hypothetical protein